MMDRYIEAADISSAWVEATSLVLGLPRMDAVHVVVRIADPMAEEPLVRDLVNELLAELAKQPVETVRNTIFPAAIAARFPQPEALAHHYRELYPTIRRFAGGRHETYFGRMVELPVAGGDAVHQLDRLAEKLREARAKTKGPLSSRYEVNIAMAGVDVNIYSGARDQNLTMGFPCLSLCSFHLADDRLHLAAHYRNQYMIERAYGNYLGLGELLGYMAEATGFEVGELLVVAGHAKIDSGGKHRLRRLLEEARKPTAQGELSDRAPNARSEQASRSARRRSRR